MGGDVDDEKSATSNLFFVGVPHRAYGLLNVDGSESDMTSPG